MKDTETKIIKSCINETVKFQCNQCNKQFAYRQSLNLHVKSLHEELSYKCDDCDKSFNIKGNLIRHKKNQH